MDPAPPTPIASPRLLGAGFLVLVSLSLLDLLVPLDRAPPLVENRPPAAWPGRPRSFAAWRALPSRFETAFGDHFGMRDSLLRIGTWYRWLVPDGTVTNGVVRGEGDWHFFAYDEQGPDWGRQLDPEGLTARCDLLEAPVRWLAGKGIRSLVCIVPAKGTIYPEYLPERLRTRTGLSVLDQVVAELERRGVAEVLDLRAPLLAEKARRRVYHRTDSHWNAIGAAVGAEQLLGRLARWFPTIDVPRAASQHFETHMYPGMDLARMLGTELLYQEEVFVRTSVDPTPVRRGSASGPPHSGLGPMALRRFLVTETDRGDLPCLMFLGDSFGEFLVPYVQARTRRMTYVRPRVLDPEMVAAERPDVVVIELVEWALSDRSLGGPILAAAPP